MRKLFDNGFANSPDAAMLARRISDLRKEGWDRVGDLKSADFSTNPLAPDLRAVLWLPGRGQPSKANSFQLIANSFQ